MKRLPNRKIIPLAAFGLLMAGAIPVNTAFITAEAAKLGLLDRSFAHVTKGRLADDITGKYNASSPFKEFGAEAFGSLSYFAFNEARTGAQIGSDGVLFSNEEFETGPVSTARIDRAVTFVASVNKALKAKGITLVIAPLPLKADIDSGHLGRLRLPAELQGRYDSVRGKLMAHGIASIDLRSRFQRANPENRMFLKSDTHWTPEGAAITAEAVADATQSLDLPAAKAVTLTIAQPVEHSGDLQKFVRLLPFLEGAGPAHDKISPLTATLADAGDSAGLFDDAGIPVVLVGTSYSANATFGFEAHLKAALRRDVLNLSEEGKGPFAPMQAFLSGPVLKATPPKLVIWEMPIRYLDDDFPAEQFTLPLALSDELRGELP
jgi:alginate O-acetyltransferase complex protein AlgJ